MAMRAARISLCELGLKVENIVIQTFHKEHTGRRGQQIGESTHISESATRSRNNQWILLLEGCFIQQVLRMSGFK